MEPSESPSSKAGELIPLLRRNLDRDWGCKVFFAGAPVLGIRLPRKRAGMMTDEDAGRIRSVLESRGPSVRLEEIADVVLLGDDTFIEMGVPELEALLRRPRSGEEACDLGEILDGFARSGSKAAAKSPASGRRAEVLARGKRGRYVRARMPRSKTKDVALAPTIRAALARSGGSVRAGGEAGVEGFSVREEDLREKVRRRKVSTHVAIVLDTSFSMEEASEATRRVVLELLRDAYQRRDRVALVSCSGREAAVVLPFTPAVATAKRHLDGIEYGGTTPLASGLAKGSALLARERDKEPSAIPILVLITDGSANVPLEVAGDPGQEAEEAARELKRSGFHLLVVDVGAGGSELAGRISAAAGGRYVRMGRPSQEEIYAAIKEEQRGAAGLVGAEGR